MKILNSFLPSSLVVLPELVSFGMLALLSLYGLKELRQGHIGRVGLAANVFLLWQLLYPNWEGLPQIAQVYVNAGNVMALIAVPSYVTKISLPSAFYKWSFRLYSSLSVLIALVALVLW